MGRSEKFPFKQLRERKSRVPTDEAAEPPACMQFLAKLKDEITTTGNLSVGLSALNHVGNLRFFFLWLRGHLIIGGPPLIQSAEGASIRSDSPAVRGTNN